MGNLNRRLFVTKIIAIISETTRADARLRPAGHQSARCPSNRHHTPKPKCCEPKGWKGLHFAWAELRCAEKGSAARKIAEKWGSPKHDGDSTVPGRRILYPEK